MTRDVVTTPNKSAPPSMPASLQMELRLVLNERLPAAFHPDAARCAQALREGMRLADETTIIDWAMKLSLGTKANRDTPLNGLTRLIALSCRELPARCFTEETLVLALQTFEWFPMPKQVHEILKPLADQWARELYSLDAMVKAPPRVAAKLSTTYQIPPAPEWAVNRTLPRRFRTIDGEAMREDLTPHPPLRTVAQQLAAMRGDPPDAA